MQCKKCHSPLPANGIVCRFCGTLMDQEQIKYQNKMKNKSDQTIMLLSEKYGHENKVTYREVKENKILGLIVIIIVLLILIFLTILVNS